VNKRAPEAGRWEKGKRRYSYEYQVLPLSVYLYRWGKRNTSGHASCRSLCDSDAGCGGVRVVSSVPWYFKLAQGCSAFRSAKRQRTITGTRIITFLTKPKHLGVMALRRFGSSGLRNHDGSSPKQAFQLHMVDGSRPSTRHRSRNTCSIPSSVQIAPYQSKRRATW
jgi:hypothetical protein